LYRGGDVTVVGGELLAVAKMDESGLYTIEVEPPQSSVMYNVPKTGRWSGSEVTRATLHLRLIHPGESILKATARQHDIKITGDIKGAEPCGTCAVAKSKRKPVRKGRKALQDETRIRCPDKSGVSTRWGNFRNLPGMVVITPSLPSTKRRDTPSFDCSERRTNR
jgi:hypothetical protein